MTSSPYLMPGLIDYHTHLLRDAAGGRPAFMYGDVAKFHDRVHRSGSTPMDVEPEPIHEANLADAVLRRLNKANENGLVEIWEAGLDHLSYLHVLEELREEQELPVRVRILVASGVAERHGMPERTGDHGVEVMGLKFYADGWLGPRTCAVSHPFADSGGTGVQFLTADEMANRMAPFAEDRWEIATHAIGDRAIEAVLDAYEKIYGSDCAIIGPRIEHGMLLRPDLLDRIVGLGVRLCIQPGFRTSDCEHIQQALADGWPLAYNWETVADRGVHLLSGSDAPLETANGVDNLFELAGQLGEGGMRKATEASTDIQSGTTLLSHAPDLNQAKPTVIGAIPNS